MCGTICTQCHVFILCFDFRLTPGLVKLAMCLMMLKVSLLFIQICQGLENSEEVSLRSVSESGSECECEWSVRSGGLVVGITVCVQQCPSTKSSMRF